MSTAADGTACCVCGASDARPWRTAGDALLGTGGTFTAVRCARCGTARLQPRPPAEEMARHYTPATYARAENDGSELGKRLDAIFTRQADRAVEVMSSLPTGDLLDVGCGDGRFLAAMAARGWRGVGIETDAVAADLARRRAGVPVHETTLEDAPFAPASFDLISFLHVLEHVPDPRAALTAARRALRPGGRLLVAVPNVGSAEAAVFGASWYHLDLPRHFWGFTPATLSRLAEECGFRVSGLRYLPWLFAPQSARNVVRSLRGGTKPAATSDDAPPPARAEGGAWQTALFLRMLGAAEVWGRFLPGEIMELTATIADTAPETRPGEDA